MIRISTRGRYALRALVDVAQHEGEIPVARHDIAQRQDISADYVAQLFRHLVEAGVVEGVKGPGGGYRLRESPHMITARDVIEAVEGPVALVECVEPGDSSTCERADACVTRALWTRLSKVIAEMLESVTLADLCADADHLAQREE